MNERTQGPLDSCYPRWIPEPHTSVFRSAHGAHPLPWTVPAARAALGQPNRRLTAGPAPQCAHVPRAWQSQERRSTCTGAGHAGRWGGAHAQRAEGADEKAGKGKMERQGVRRACFLRAGGGRTVRERPRSQTSTAYTHPATCLLTSRPSLAWLGPNFLTDRLGPD